ncbi:MAG: Hsp20/alpha crystallin family protein [Acidobacteriota bacterium]
MLTNYDPFAENRLFPVDVLETENELVLKADLPEARPEDVKIEIEQDTLSIRGERKLEKLEGKDARYHRIERGYGEFQRLFGLPETVDAEKVKAEYKDGVLTVRLPKKEVARPRTIKVEVAAA